MQNARIIDKTRQDKTRQAQSCSEISAVMPSIPQDIDTVIRNTEFFFKYLPIKNIYIIGPDAVAERIRRENDSRLIFMNENEFVDVQRIRELYSSRTDKSPNYAGWYVQQFIKMQFANFTSDEYYLIWDSDTIPLGSVNMFNENDKPFFDMKTEYHAPYFETINKLFPDIHKTSDRSFISEHMIIKSEYMRELISEIEANKSIEGKNFQEKIINAIQINDLAGSGFSEFETFGSYVTVRHAESYVLRTWHSLRCGRRFYDKASRIDESNRIWLAGKYNAISLEKRHRPSFFSYLIRSRLFHSMFSPKLLERMPRPLLEIVITKVRKMLPDKYVPFVKRILHMK